jgi:hypothetical protein
MPLRVSKPSFRSAGLAAAAWALAVIASAGFAPPASAFCSMATPNVFFFEFAPGEHEVPPALVRAFVAHLFPDLAGGDRYVDSYTILASGDLAEGPEWDDATPAAQAADHLLGEKRAAAIEAMIRKDAGPSVRSEVFRVFVRPNRQVLTASDMAANPALTPRVRAGVRADVRDRPVEREKGEPVPLC